MWMELLHDVLDGPAKVSTVRTDAVWMGNRRRGALRHANANAKNGKVLQFPSRKADVAVAMAA
jgi:hypothetical protein